MEVEGTNRALVIGAQGVLGALTVRAFEAGGWAVRSGARRPRPGQIEIDLDHSDLRGVDAADLPLALVTCASAAVVTRGVGRPTP